MNTKTEKDGRPVSSGDAEHWAQIEKRRAQSDAKLDRPNKEARERAEEDSAELDQPLTCRAFLLGCAYLKNGGEDLLGDFRLLKEFLVDDGFHDYCHHSVEIEEREKGGSHVKKPIEREFFVEIGGRGFFASPERMITIREVNYRTSAALMEYSASLNDIHCALQRMRRKGLPSKKRIVIPIHRLERDLINAAKWSILRGISPEDFVAIAHKAFEQTANLITSNNNPNHESN